MCILDKLANFLLIFFFFFLQILTDTDAVQSFINLKNSISPTLFILFFDFHLSTVLIFLSTALWSEWWLPSLKQAFKVQSHMQGRMCWEGGESGHQDTEKKEEKIYWDDVRAGKNR